MSDAVKEAARRAAAQIVTATTATEFDWAKLSLADASADGVIADFDKAHGSTTIQRIAEIIIAELSVHQPDVQAADAIQLLRELRSLLFVSSRTEQVKTLIERINAVEDAALAASPVQADEVTRALEELREMFPDSLFTEITHGYGGFEEHGFSWRWTVIVAEKAQYGETLSEAMQRVREWKEQQK